MENVKAMAFKALVKFNVDALPVDTFSIANKMPKVKIMSYSKGWWLIEELGEEEYANNHNGITIVYDDMHMILYTDKLSYSERNFTIAHEIGHIILKHTSQNKILGKDSDSGIENMQEAEADIFAYSFVAPAPILFLNKTNTLDKISEITGLSKERSVHVLGNITHEKTIKHSPGRNELIKAFGLRNADMKRKEIVKNIFLSLLILVLLGAAAYQVNLFINGSAVYITATGDKYHTKNCNYVNVLTATKLSMKEAVSKNYEPCTVCKPKK